LLQKEGFSFSEEKEGKKTFIFPQAKRRSSSQAPGPARRKSLLVLFFRKEHSSHYIS
jgi:hypothetical protein